MVFVSIPRTEVLFCMWETCLLEYAVFAATNQVSDRMWEKPGFAQELTHPVVNVRWDDAKGFCSWLTRVEHGKGLLREGQYYRLPTDAEWSKAAGLIEPEKGEPGDRAALLPDQYSWGKEWPPTKGAGNYCRIYRCDSYDYTSPIGAFAPNQFGLYDMGGNVGNWVEDRYSKTQSECRAWRNTGTWYGDGTAMLSLTGRGCNWPDFPYYALGFRVVLAAKPIEMMPTDPPNRDAQEQARKNLTDSLKNYKTATSVKESI
jgi:formylglycine-generating enzyme required for sulfatase activity